VTPEQVDAWGKASRAASGKPLKIEDPAVLARLVTLAFADERDGGGPSKTRRRAGITQQPTAARRAAGRRAEADAP
jgi:hypothetical protein